MAAEDLTATKLPTIGAALARKRSPPEAVVEHIGEGDDLIAGMGNSEPVTVLDAIEAYGSAFLTSESIRCCLLGSGATCTATFLTSATFPGFSHRPTARPSTKGCVI
jgi:hypothetical protein